MGEWRWGALSTWRGGDREQGGTQGRLPGGAKSWRIAQHVQLPGGVGMHSTFWAVFKMAGTCGRGVWWWVERIGKEGSGERWFAINYLFTKWATYRESLVTWLWSRISHKAHLKHLEMDVIGQLTRYLSIHPAPVSIPRSVMSSKH